MSAVARPIGQPYLSTSSPLAAADGDLVALGNVGAGGDRLAVQVQRLAGDEVAQRRRHVVARVDAVDRFAGRQGGFAYQSLGHCHFSCCHPRLYMGKPVSVIGQLRGVHPSSDAPR
jgi:hypothetical protein